MSSAVTQHGYSPPRGHWNQSIEKRSVRTRRCLASHSPNAPLTLVSVSCSLSSTSLWVTLPHLCSESIFIPLHASGTSKICPLVLSPHFSVFSWDFCNYSPSCFPQHLPCSPSLAEFRPQLWLFFNSWRWLVSLYTWPPSRFSLPCLTASLASCPRCPVATHTSQDEATHLILPSHTVSLFLHF